jgi:hypothetical protein
VKMVACRFRCASRRAPLPARYLGGAGWNTLFGILPTMIGVRSTAQCAGLIGGVYLVDRRFDDAKRSVRAVRHTCFSTGMRSYTWGGIACAVAPHTQADVESNERDTGKQRA